MIWASMRGGVFAGLVTLLLLSSCSDTRESSSRVAAIPRDFVGSTGCIDCHEKFYDLWSDSRHGLAMQPVTPEFIAKELDPHEAALPIGPVSFQARIQSGEAWIEEDRDGELTRFPVLHALGGKNIYYFLTPLERGMLQVLPLAFDVREREWFDTTASMVRHFRDREDEALDWRERPLTFNTSCYGCHVSQLSTNYDPHTDTYRTEWGEPGINCETCHGPGGEHARYLGEAGEEAPDDLKIILTSSFTARQMNDMCATCHAKMYPISTTFTPGDRFFDHFGLHTQEHQDFYPDGRDLGENYTFTSWRMSPCLADTSFDCVHCHTSSGRNRHTGDEADNACLPCHETYVSDPEPHTFHAAESEGSRCIACHMPRTVFARMERHDHSMLPPTPATTIRYGSPNACNICHAEESAEWADEWVRKWYKRDYQASVLRRSSLLDEARQRDWGRLEEMLEYISSDDREEIVANSLVRLLENCSDPRKWETLKLALRDPSPLVRGSAAAALRANLNDEETIELLLESAQDDFRIVRIQTAATLSLIPERYWSADQLGLFRQATREYEASLRARPDDWSLKYNLGNYYLNQGKLEQALQAFQASHRLNPGTIAPLVNASMVYARQGKSSEAESSLRDALEIEPESPIANFNFGLLMAERNRLVEAERLLRKTLEADPQFADAAYNLGVLLAERQPEESLYWSRRAYELHPNDPKYAYTFAFYLNRQGRQNDSIGLLEDLVKNGNADASIYGLLGSQYEQAGAHSEASSLYRRASRDESLSPQQRIQFEAKVR